MDLLVSHLLSTILILDPPEEYKEQPTLDTPEQVPEQVRTQHSNQFWTNNENILRLVIAIGLTQLSVKEMMSAVNLKHRPNFLEYTLNPAIEGGWVRMLYPQSPRHPRQKYLLTVKGMGLYNKMKHLNVSWN